LSPSYQSLSNYIWLPTKVLEDFSINTLINQRLYDYAQLDGYFPSITLGVAMGGATSYLSTALGGPFLPQAFVITLKGGSPTGDVKQYFNRSFKAALQIAEANPEIITIQH